MTLFKKCKSSSYTLALGLMTLLTFSASPISSSTKDKPNSDESNYYFHLRPRLGHFARAVGYLKIFEEYFDNVIKKYDKAMEGIDLNDWRNVRPTGERCVDFLLGFQARNYRLNKPYDIIPLDACLDWLMDDSSEKKEDFDRFNKKTKAEYTTLDKDLKFKEIYSSTSFKNDKISHELKEKLHEYFSKLLKVNAENPTSGCHSLWLEGYNDFIEEVYLGDCDSDDDDDGDDSDGDDEDEENQDCAHFGLKEDEEDAYLDLIVDATKQASKNCYNVMQKKMIGYMRAAYAEDSASVQLTRKIKAATSKVARQSGNKKWGREMILILQLVSGVDPNTPVDLAEVVESLNNLKNNDKSTVERFTETLGNYAIQNIDMKKSSNDPDGRIRYGKAMTKLCKPYITKTFLSQTGGSTLWEDPTSTKKPFEFYNIIYSLIQLTNHLSFYGITKNKFEEDVLDKGWEALYLTTFACQIISTTWAELVYETNEPSYLVNLRPNARILIDDWPIAVLREKLPQIPKELENDERKTEVRSSFPKLGLKFKSSRQNSHKKSEPEILHLQSKLGSPASASASASSTKASALQEPIPAISTTTTAPAPTTIPKISVSTSIPKLAISSETIELFRQLHGRYPKNLNIGEPSSLKDKTCLLESDVPLAFEFNRKFVVGKNKIEDTSKHVSQDPTNKWAGLDAIYL